MAVAVAAIVVVVGELLEVTIDAVVPGGEGISRRPGKPTVFVDRALPGEHHLVEILSEHKKFVRAHSVEVIAASPERIEPPCDAFVKGCGGCQWQFATHEQQQAMKLQMVEDCLRRIAGRSDIDVRSGGSVSAFGYRSTVRVRGLDGKPAFRKQSSNELVAIERCPVAVEDVNDMLSTVEVDNDEEVIVRIPSPIEVCGRQFEVSPGAFFQSGLQAAELLSETVDRLVDDQAKSIADLYAGVGLLGAIAAARRNCHLLAVESNAAACEDARLNLSDLDAQVIRSEIARLNSESTGVFDVVIADPPRSGLGKSAASVVASMATNQIVLVSCDPASMARDIGLLADRGFEVSSVEVLDLFPQTHHVETVTTLVRSHYLDRS